MGSKCTVRSRNTARRDQDSQVCGAGRHSPGHNHVCRERRHGLGRHLGSRSSSMAVSTSRRFGLSPSRSSPTPRFTTRRTLHIKFQGRPMPNSQHWSARSLRPRTLRRTPIQAFIDVYLRDADLSKAKALVKHSNLNPLQKKKAARFFRDLQRHQVSNITELFSTDLEGVCAGRENLNEAYHQIVVGTGWRSASCTG